LGTDGSGVAKESGPTVQSTTVEQTASIKRFSNRSLILIGVLIFLLLGAGVIAYWSYSR
jgi:hypothetical protein